jgi:PAS domain S-box-containing protein
LRYNDPSKERMCNGAIPAPKWLHYIDARMTPLVPLKTMVTKPSPLFQELSDLLLSGLEFVGATTGWIGLQDTVGLSFPVHIDISSNSRLPWQHSQDSVWGFTINDETAILNDLASGSKWGDLPLRNLLSCPLIQNKQILGHVALANKADNFTNEDTVVLRGLAHHTARLLGRRQTSKPRRVHLSSALQRILDRATEGVLLLEESGVLAYANPAWLDWTGFRAEELLGKTAPFPFWVSQYELVRAVNLAPPAPVGALPFRRRDESLFWCTVETIEEEWGDDFVTMVFFRQTSASPQRAGSVSDGKASVAYASGSLDVVPAALDLLPLLLDLDQGIEGWDARWEERTGLAVSDVKDNRCDLVLDWLFPQQQDRNRVADCFHHPHPKGCLLTLEVAASNGSRPMLCTFLPLPATIATALPRRWVLLVGEVQGCTESNLTDGTRHKEPAAIIVPERT